MAKPKAKTTGEELEEQLLQAIHAAGQAPLPGARDLPVLHGIHRGGDFLQHQENVLVKTAAILVTSGQVFTFGDGVVMQVGAPDSPGARLPTLRVGTSVERGAMGLLANLFICQSGPKQFPPPRWFLEVLLHAAPVLASLPAIRHYARRPVFDDGFVLHGPGWHSDAGVLVLGPAVEPAEIEVGDPHAPALERLPHHLQTLLQGFCFRSDADLVNAVAMLLTGVLMNHFIELGKAVPVMDGNQPNLGKTWLVRVAGILLDGVDPRPIPFTPDDEELQKKICAALREGRQSVLLIDNAKLANGAEINSPTIEAGSTAPEISLRILGVSENYTRPNDLLWALTMNRARLSHDLVTRSLPIRLFYEGKTEDRTFEGPNPLTYAREHRLDILGELAGMVVRWNQQGRPPGQRPHRLKEWAAVIGGILATAGLPEFLGNAGEAAAEFNAVLDELAALAEAVVKGGGPAVIAATPTDEEE